MFLILSAAYIERELESEFGQLPPSFLPLGNKRLFQHQVKLAPKGCKVFLTIPESYAISAPDRKWLDDNHVNILEIPENLSLGASIVAAVNLSGHSLDSDLHLLYGDSLFKKLPKGKDIASTSTVSDSYNWASVSETSQEWIHPENHDLNIGSRVIDGYFKFSNPRLLISAVTKSKWDFLKGLSLYHKETGLAAIESDGWLDFGHVNTYYNSKARFTTQRSFNELTITSQWVEKSSHNNIKIQAESNWFNRIPFELREYTPQFLGSNQASKSSYKLEFLYLTALNELFVFSKLPSHAWRNILASCISFLNSCTKFHPQPDEPKNELNTLFVEKTNSRVADYCLAKGIDKNEPWFINGYDGVSLKQLMAESQKYLPSEHFDSSVLHGDFCFSNILYDFRSRKIKTIDPRGLNSRNELTIYGDIRYDLAKLSHSILGLYDWIIAGQYNIESEGHHITLDIGQGDHIKEIQCIFVDLITKSFPISEKELYAMQVQLFISMLPLHSDDEVRQLALFANAFLLYNKLKSLG